MPMTPQLFSISGAAVELATDRRTIAAALANVAPDGKLGQHPAWRLRTVLDALGYRGSQNKPSSADLDEMERLAEALDAGFKRVEAEPDITKRRAMMREIGPNVGRLDRIWARLNATAAPAERDMVERYRDMVLGQAIGNVLALCNWNFIPDKS
jgi:hypothetical protein